MINKSQDTTFSYCRLSCTIKLSCLIHSYYLKAIDYSLFPAQCVHLHEPNWYLIPTSSTIDNTWAAFSAYTAKEQPGRTQMANMHNGLNQNYAHVSGSLNAFSSHSSHTGQQLLEVSGNAEQKTKTRKSDNKTIIKIQRISGTRPSQSRR